MLNSNIVSELMQKSKKENKQITYSNGDNRLVVEYVRERNIYLYRYSWIISNSAIKVEDLAKDSEYNNLFVRNSMLYLNEKSKDFQNVDVVQIAMVTIRQESEDFFNEKFFMEKLDSIKKDSSSFVNETKYYFLGKKIISVLQSEMNYYNPIEYAPFIPNWNIEGICEDKQYPVHITSSIEYKYCLEGEKVIFSIGGGDLNTTFEVKTDDLNLVCIPMVICSKKKYTIMKYESLKDGVSSLQDE